MCPSSDSAYHQSSLFNFAETPQRAEAHHNTATDLSLSFLDPLDSLDDATNAFRSKLMSQKDSFWDGQIVDHSTPRSAASKYIRKGTSLNDSVQTSQLDTSVEIGRSNTADVPFSIQDHLVHHQDTSGRFPDGQHSLTFSSIHSAHSDGSIKNDTPEDSSPTRSCGSSLTSAKSKKQSKKIISAAEAKQISLQRQYKQEEVLREYRIRLQRLYKAYLRVRRDSNHPRDVEKFQSAWKALDHGVQVVEDLSSITTPHPWFLRAGFFAYLPTGYYLTKLADFDAEELLDGCDEEMHTLGTFLTKFEADNPKKCSAEVLAWKKRDDMIWWNDKNQRNRFR